jgi:hypothetical protein
VRLLPTLWTIAGFVQMKKAIAIFASCITLVSTSSTVESCQEPVANNTEETWKFGSFELLPEVKEGARKSQFPTVVGDGLIGQLGNEFAIYFLAIHTAFPDLSADDSDFLPPKAREARWLRNGMPIRISVTCTFGRDAVVQKDSSNLGAESEENDIDLVRGWPSSTPVIEAFYNEKFATSHCLVICEIPVERDGRFATIRMSRLLELSDASVDNVNWRQVGASEIAVMHKPSPKKNDSLHK